MTFDRTEWVWINGKMVRWADASLHVSAHAMHYGTGVFEGMRCYESADGPAVFRMDAHIDRLYASAAVYGMEIPYTRGEFADAVCETIRRNGFASCYVRPICVFGSRALGLHARACPVDVGILAWPWGALLGDDSLQAGVRVTISPWVKFHSRMMPTTAKACGQYLNSILAKIESHKAGYQEAILLDDHGFVCEGSGENIFVVRDGRIVTPPQTAGILDGINRKSAIQIAHDLGFEVVERNIGRAELYLADEIYLTGTAAELVPVREIDDHAIGDGRPGEVTRAVQKAFDDALHGRTERYREWLDPVPVRQPVA